MCNQFYIFLFVTEPQLQVCDMKGQCYNSYDITPGEWSDIQISQHLEGDMYRYESMIRIHPRRNSQASAWLIPCVIFYNMLIILFSVFLILQCEIICAIVSAPITTYAKLLGKCTLFCFDTHTHWSISCAHAGLFAFSFVQKNIGIVPGI